jgi:hypothetical protein
MRGYIGNTDRDWYDFLRARPLLEEVNFWQPSGSRGFQAILPGAPFFFRLKKPYYAIAGFGYFSFSRQLSPLLAWDAFQEANGAPSFLSMRQRIDAYRKKNNAAPAEEAPPATTGLQPEGKYFFVLIMNFISEEMLENQRSPKRRFKEDTVTFKPCSSGKRRSPSQHRSTRDGHYRSIVWCALRKKTWGLGELRSPGLHRGSRLLL